MKTSKTKVVTANVERPQKNYTSNWNCSTHLSSSLLTVAQGPSKHWLEDTGQRYRSCDWF